MNQRKGVRGNDSCGCHAWKNALVGLGIATAPTPKEQDELTVLLSDKIFFDDVVFPFIPKPPASAGDQDVTIAHLKEAFGKLDEAKTPDPRLQRLCEIFANNQESFSIFCAQETQLHYYPETLHNLTSLLFSGKKPGPWTHAFIFGTQGHWTTLFLQRDAEERFY